MYISQDPIRLRSGKLSLYSYVHNPNAWVDKLGLAATCEEEIQDLPEFEGMTRDEIHEELENRGYTKIKDIDGNQTFVLEADDGTYAVVRTDRAIRADEREGGLQGYADESAHAHKETAKGYEIDPDDGQGYTRGTKTYDDQGNRVKANNEERKRSIHIPINE